jgi:hypothetical protein
MISQITKFIISSNVKNISFNQALCYKLANQV